MSADESFLDRWARRKRGAARRVQSEPTPKKTGTDAAPEVEASLPPEETQSLFDPASLPPIESIGAGSDIRPFLNAGVPTDLTRAALRRAWSADPAIREFIGLSENSWDFNAPGAVSGFGSLTSEDAHRLLSRVSGETEASEAPRPPGERLSDDQAPVPADGRGQQKPGLEPDQMKLAHDADADHRNSVSRAEASNIAMQHDGGEGES
jgi:Protein of unknown function (DUF3306)